MTQRKSMKGLVFLENTYISDKKRIKRYFVCDEKKIKSKDIFIRKTGKFNIISEPKLEVIEVFIPRKKEYSDILNSNVFGKNSKERRKNLRNFYY